MSGTFSRTISPTPIKGGETLSLIINGTPCFRYVFAQGETLVDGVRDFHAAICASLPAAAHYSVGFTTDASGAVSFSVTSKNGWDLAVALRATGGLLVTAPPEAVGSAVARA